MDPVEALTRLGGVARAHDLLLSTTRARLRHAVAAGTVLSVRHGYYALPAATHARRTAATLGGVASHLRAAAVLGWEIARQPASPQVVLPRHRPLVPHPGVELHRRPLGRDDVQGLATSPLLTVLMCARDLPFDEALAVADSALRHGDLDPDRLVAGADSWPARVRRVAAYADARAANPFESVLRALAIGAGAEVVPQYEVRAGGMTLHPDLVDPLRGLVLEADSWGFHSSRYDHDRDCVRYNALTADEWRVLRFTYAHAMYSPTYVDRTVRTLMDSAA